MRIIQEAVRKIKHNGKKGFICLFAIIAVALLTPLIANEKPLLVRYKGDFIFPMIEEKTDLFFNGSLSSEADYHDSFTQQEIRRNGFMIFPPIPFSENTIDFQSDVAFPAPPSARHLLGTDDIGRDILSRSLYGLRISLGFGFLLALLSTVIGIFVGSVQGYFGGKTDLWTQRFLEIWTSLPQLFVLIILSSLMTPSFASLLFVLLLFSWTALVGVVRAEFLRVRNFDYIKYAQSLGVPPFRIIFKHLLPNALVSVFSYFPFILAGAVVSLTSLDFLGFGLPPENASLGELIRQGKENISAPWIGLTVIGLLSFVLTVLILTGQTLRDAFDPKKEDK